MILNPEERRIFEALSAQYESKQAPLMPGYYLESINPLKDYLLEVLAGSIEEMGGIEGSDDIGGSNEAAAFLRHEVTQHKHAMPQQGDILFASGKGMVIVPGKDDVFFTEGVYIKGRFLAVAVESYREFADIPRTKANEQFIALKGDQQPLGLHWVISDPELISREGEVIRLSEDIAFLPLHYDELDIERVIAE